MMSVLTEESDHVDMIYLYFAKAFDKVDHSCGGYPLVTYPTIQKYTEKVNK